MQFKSKVGVEVGTICNKKMLPNIFHVNWVAQIGLSLISICRKFRFRHGNIKLIHYSAGTNDTHYHYLIGLVQLKAIKYLRTGQMLLK
jgi:hypothetical protein